MDTFPAVNGAYPLVGRQGLLRELNHRAVTEYIARTGPASRAELAANLGLSRASVTRLVDALIGIGLLREGARVSSRAGRRRVLLDINPEAGLVMGASVRPKRTRVWLADLRGTVVTQDTESTSATNAGALVDQLARMATAGLGRHKKSGARVTAVSVGITAAWDRRASRLHAAPNLPQLEGVDLSRLLADGLMRALGPSSAPAAIAVENDVNLAALGEQAHGIAKGRSNFFYLSLGSGVGGATVIDQQLLVGEDGFAGEIGYLPVTVDGKTVPLEDLVSRGALAARASALGVGPDAEDLLEAAAAGDPAARSEVRAVGRHLSAAVAAITALLNPECIVLGGSVGRHAETLLPAIEDSLLPELPIRTEIVGTALSGDASLMGAVHLAGALAREALITEANL